MKDLQYTTGNYTVAIAVAKTPTEVFSTITNDVAKFWPEGLSGQCNQQGDEFVFITGDSHYSKSRVEELVPDKRVVWLVTESIRKTDGFDWTGTKMIFDITPKGDTTQLAFTYLGPVLKDEYDRLVWVCDMVIKERLYNLLVNSSAELNTGKALPDDESFTTTIEIAGTPQYIYECIKKVPVWWTTDFEGSNAKVGDEFTIHHPGAHYSKQSVLEDVPGKKIVWLVTDSTLYWLKGNQHEWSDTKMIFNLSPQGDKTQLHFTHEGLTPDKKCYALCNKGWTEIIMKRLVDFVTVGKTR